MWECMWVMIHTQLYAFVWAYLILLQGCVWELCAHTSVSPLGPLQGDSCQEVGKQPDSEACDPP